MLSIYRCMPARHLHAAGYHVAIGQENGVLALDSMSVEKRVGGHQAIVRRQVPWHAHSRFGKLRRHCPKVIDGKISGEQVVDVHHQKLASGSCRRKAAPDGRGRTE